MKTRLFKTNQKKTPNCSKRYSKLFKEIQYSLFSHVNRNILRKYSLNFPFIYITSIREQ